MKKLLILFALFAATVAVAQKTPVPVQPYENFVQVTGSAERKVTPDEIYVRIVIDEKELKQSKNVEQMEQAMIKTLAAQGIDTDKNLKIDRMSSDYKDYFLKSNQARTRVTYELKVASAQELGKAYQALESQGISNMAIARQTHSRLKEIQRELRIEAMKNAQATAQDLLGAVGQKLGPAVMVADYGNGSGVMYKSAMTRDMVAGVAYNEAAYETPLALSDMELTYSVSVKFAIVFSE